VRHVLADLAVAAGRAALEHAVAVDQRDREAVDLGLADERKRGSSIPSRARWARIRATQARSSCSERTFASDSIGWRWTTFSSRSTGSPPGRWVGESGVTSSGCACSISTSSSVERVVLLVADLRVVST
jgi:hypothetical protein